MTTYNRAMTKALKQCSTDGIAVCSLTLGDIQSRIGNPAGVGKQDEINPHYKGKIKKNGDKLEINLSYLMTGNIARVKAAVENIQKVYATQKVIINFTPKVQGYDLRIHGASLGEMVAALGLCDCEAALYIGGWGPSYKHATWGKALLVNPVSPKSTWRITDAHEFGHKLGLKHREDLGIMDYPPKTGRDRRKFIESDRKRIANLYT